ncbi:MAG: DNA cytosine methyltransferase [Myxococcota bacterium]|nr:DNA cytosine methyltransferase [Myxococcota bacterium]OQC39246.1 MAG: Modification methylase HaeIII [Deltaproteobacteria bacterium ADurb.Bin058]HHW97038.1 DNA cytosine methyltransferase [Oligoflexales bacterium]MBP8970720.1 DNA cytosine methyltransferase [Myxococcota bacterium]HQC44222.1 DNA cytosine methyltransferase [Myxococcota bacterium]
MTRRPTVVDLFAGVGGMSLGFEQAGFDIAAAVELDPIHAAVHHFNFPQTAMLASSVVGLDVRSILSHPVCSDTLRNGVDVVCGGAPCQGFSLIGQRMMADPRNMLVRQFVRLVAGLDAKYFVFENVKGLTIGNHRKFLQLLISEFEERGYQITQPWRVLNAKNYGVPQNRERLFLLGAKAGLPLPQYPEAYTADEPTLFSSGLVSRVPTCVDALDDLPDNMWYPELVTEDFVHIEDWNPSSDFAKEMHCMTDACWHFGYPRRWDSSLLTSSMQTTHSEVSRLRFKKTPHGQVEPVSRFFKLPPNGYSNTLRAGTDSARGAFTSPRPIHYRYDRCVSVREMARLHGYPDWFRFHVTKWHGARQVGNSVPPPLARAVATSIIKALSVEPQSPQQTIDLGSPDLLKMNMSQASKFWNVEVPIKSRTRKIKADEHNQEDHFVVSG